MAAKTLGILGGGQLERMTAMAAAQLGIRTAIYAQDSDEPACQVVRDHIIGDWDDHKKLEDFAHQVDVITYAYENIPVSTIEFLENITPVYPKKNLLEVAQDRVEEKSFLNQIGIPTAHWKKITSIQDIEDCFQDWSAEEIILKTCREGYDGKGQKRIHNQDNLTEVHGSFDGAEIIAEQIIDFEVELSIIIAKDMMGHTALYGPVMNTHKNHILDETHFPAPINPGITNKAKALAENIAEKTDLIGVLAIELFLTKNGEILANEIAPRPHNSGHWTIDACATSQFDQHARTVCGLTIGSSEAHSNAIMRNLIGDDIFKADKYLEEPSACLHIYGKNEIRPGRKMGHVTFLKSLQEK